MTDEREPLDAFLRQAGLADPRSEAEFLTRALLYTERRMLEEAERDCRSAIALEASAVAYAALGTVLFTARRHQEALDALAESLRLGPTATAHMARAEILCLLEDDDGALRELDAALTADPANPDALLDRGRLLYDLRRDADAERDFTALIGLRPDGHAGYYHRSRVRYEQGRYQESLADADAADRLHPDDPEVLTFRSRIHRRLERLDLALEDLDRAISLDPDHRTRFLYRARVHRELAAEYRAQGRDADAALHEDRAQRDSVSSVFCTDAD